MKSAEDFEREQALHDMNYPKPKCKVAYCGNDTQAFNEGYCYSHTPSKKKENKCPKHIVCNDKDCYAREYHNMLPCYCKSPTPQPIQDWREEEQKDFIEKFVYEKLMCGKALSGSDFDTISEYWLSRIESFLSSQHESDREELMKQIGFLKMSSHTKGIFKNIQGSMLSEELAESYNFALSDCISIIRNFKK